MRGLTLRLTNATATVVAVPDLPGVAPFAPGEARELLYVSEVQNSLEYGSINALLIGGKLTAQFVSGTVLNQAPVGRTFTGASPTADGERGLVPPAPTAIRGNYLKADGTWSPVTPPAIGAIPQSVLTTQGDTLYRGVTTTERLPLGTLGQSYRAGTVIPEWRDATLSGLLTARPSPSAYYQGVFFWATDTSEVTLCYYDGSAYVWGSTGGAPLSNAVPQPLGSATAGAGVAASRDDHVHAMPTASDVGAIPNTALTSGNPSALGTVGPGSSSDVARLDHVHPMPSAGDVGALPTSALTATTPQPLGVSAAGISSDVARVDHVHAMPAFPPAMIPLGGYATVDGTLGTVAIGGSPYALIDTDYDRTGLTATWEFVVGASVTAPDVGTVVLWDVGAAAAAGTISVTSATPVTSHSTTFTAPVIPTTYELRASVTGGGGGNYVVINSAAIRITWA